MTRTVAFVQDPPAGSAAPGVLPQSGAAAAAASATAAQTAASTAAAAASASAVASVQAALADEVAAAQAAAAAATTNGAAQVTLAAAEVAKAAGWAEGTEPGGAGTKSAKGHAQDAAASAAGIPAGLRPANFLFDPFAEVVSLDRNFAGFAHFPVTPTFATASANNPLPTPAMTSTAAAIRRCWPRSVLPIRAGDQVTFAALSWGDSSGRAIAIEFQSGGVPVASGSFQSANVATAGLVTLTQTVTVPAATWDRVQVSVIESGGNGAHEVFGFAAAVGSVTPQFTRAAPSREWAEALPMVPNALFAPFAEELVGITTDAAGRALMTGTAQATSANSPWGRGSIVHASSADRHIYSSTDLPMLAGDVLCIRVASASATSHALYFQDSSGNSIGGNPFLTRTVSGAADETYWVTVPAGAIARIKVRASGTNPELTAVAIARGYARPQFTPGPAPQWWIDAKITAGVTGQADVPVNYFPDPYFRQLAQGIRTQDGFRRTAAPSVSGGVYLAEPTLEAAPALSPWSKTLPRALKIPSGRGTVDFPVLVDRLHLRVGEQVNILIGLVHSQQVNCVAYLRTHALGTIVFTSSTGGTATVSTDTYSQVTISFTVTQAMVDTAGVEGAVLTTRVLFNQTANANGVWIVGHEITKGTAQLLLDPRRSVTDDLRAIATQRRSEGGEKLREIRRKLTMLRTGAPTLAVVGVFGDSWSFNHRRYVGKLLDLLRGQVDATGARLPLGGPGYTDYGHAQAKADASTLVADVIGGPNTLPDIYTCAKTGTWTQTQNSPAPGIYANTATSGSALIETTGPASPQIASAKLVYEASADGAIRWRWGTYSGSGSTLNPASYAFGTWTDQSLVGTVGSVAVVDMSAGIPTGAGWMLQVERTAGTVKLYGDFKTAATGVVVSKMASSGRQISDYTALDATRWQTGIAASPIDCAIIMFGTNDQNAVATRPAFAANLRALATRIRAAHPNADILFVPASENGRTTNTFPMSYYSDEMRRIAREVGGAWTDPQDAFGWPPSSYMDSGSRPLFAVGDPIHPEPSTGGAALAAEVAGVILNG